MMLLEDIWGDLTRALAVGSRAQARLDGFYQGTV